MKRLYVMSPGEHAIFTEACNPPALLVVTAGNTPAWSKHVKAMEFWEAMAELHAFDLSTLEPPREGEHIAYYRATPLEAA